MAPAPKKSVIFEQAWNAMWSSAPIRAAGWSSPSPRRMYESWLMVEYASRRLRLSWTSATSDPHTIVKLAATTRMSPIPRSLSVSTPNTSSTIRHMAKTPIFTTATACSRALTGVGATIAAGSHEWTGITPLLAMPAMNSRNVSVTTPADAFALAISPPVPNSKLPVVPQTRKRAGSWNAMDVPRR